MATKKVSKTAPKLYYLRLSKVTGVIIVAQRSTHTYQGTKEQLEVKYKEILTHNLLFGWWGIFAVIWNVMVLTSNAKALRQLRSL